MCLGERTVTDDNLDDSIMDYLGGEGMDTDGEERFVDLAERAEAIWGEIGAADPQAEKGAAAKQGRKDEVRLPSYNGQLYQAIQKRKRAMQVPKIIGGLGSAPCYHGTLIPRKDPRVSNIEVTLNYEEKVAMTTSFSMDDKRCLSCKGGHDVLYMRTVGGLSVPVCIVLSDQNFPPTLPGKVCWPVIRIEDGSLHEMAKKLEQICRGAHLPSGTVVVLSSLSHLARVGLEGYCEDLVDVLAKIERGFGGHVRPVHGVPLLTDGVVGDQLARDLHDLMVWLEEADKRKRYTLHDTYKTYLDKVVCCGPVTSSTDTTLLPRRLPVNMTSREKMAFLTNPVGRISNCKTSEGAEAAVCKGLLDEVVLEYSLSPRARVANTEERASAKGLTYIVAGGSHASRLASCLQKLKVDVRDLTHSGWKMEEDSIRYLAEDISTAIASTEGTKTVLILQLLDNEIYHGAKSDTDFSKGSYKGADGRYHIEGALAISTEEMLKDTFVEAMPIFRAGKSLPTVLVGPIPRYVMARCCDHPGHLTNYGKDFFTDSVVKGIKEVGKQLKRLIFYRGMKNVFLLNPNQAIREVATTGEALAALWTTDPVHPTMKAYEAIAKSAMHKAAEALSKWSENVVAKGTKRHLSDSATGETDSDVEVIGTTVASDHSGPDHLGGGWGSRQRLTPEGGPDRTPSHSGAGHPAGGRRDGWPATSWSNRGGRGGWKSRRY